jgi:hypothetical protein
MKLEQQVCSLDLSRRLKELGVKQASLFVWFENRKNQRTMLAFKTETGYYAENDSGFSYGVLQTCEVYSAFTVAELGEMLKLKGRQIFTNYVEDEDDWCLFVNIGKEALCIQQMPPPKLMRELKCSCIYWRTR